MFGKRRRGYGLSYKANKKDYKKRYRIMCGVVVLLIGMMGFFVYINADYLIFKYLITGHYVHTETLTEIYEDTIGIREEERFFRDFDKVAIAIITERIREVGGDRYTYLYTPQQYTDSIEWVKTRANDFVIEQLDVDTVYVNIPNISKYTRRLLNENRDFMEQYNNIVIDLRDNTGGNLSELYKIANMFLERGAIIGREEARTALFTRTATANSSRFLEFDNIYILQNNNTASAAEGFIMALKENLSNVTTIGTDSFGKGIGQVTLPIRHGFAIRATVIKIFTPQNNSIHEIGIEPDIIFEGEGIPDINALRG